MRAEEGAPAEAGVETRRVTRSSRCRPRCSTEVARPDSGTAAMQTATVAALPAPHPEPATPLTDARRVWWIVAAVLVLEALAVAADLLWGGAAAISTEERFNAQAGAQLACGHLDRLLDLRYRAFCGGCSAEALAAAPLFRVLGTTVLAWKLVPAALHLLTATAGTALVGRAGGARSAIAFALLVLGAPAAWRSLSLTGFGNHAEAMAFVLLSGLLLALGLDRTRRAIARLPLLFAAGVVAGFAAWFAYSAAFAAVALLLLSLAAWRRAGPVALVGLPLGLAPLWWHLQERPDELARAQVRWSGPTLAPADATWRWLVGDFHTGSLWPAVDAGGLSTAWWLLLLAAGAAGLVAGWRRGGPAGRWLLLATGSFLAATLLRYDLWQDNPAVLGFDPFNLRYRTPLLVLLALGAALLPGLRGRLARPGAAVVLALATTGIFLRVGSWQGPAVDLDAQVLIAGDRADATVPEGEPPRRLARALGRPQDLAAAQAFLATHDDPLPACRADHLAELGRRAAIAASLGHGDQAIAALVQAQHHPDATPALAAGLRRGAAESGLSADDTHDWLERELPVLARAVRQPSDP